MTTPSKYRRLNEAANLYIEFALTTMKLCETIVNMKAKVSPPEGIDPELAKFIEKIARATEEAFKGELMPFVVHLEKVDAEIKKNIPDPNRRIITPDDTN